MKGRRDKPPEGSPPASGNPPSGAPSSVPKLPTDPISPFRGTPIPPIASPAPASKPLSPPPSSGPGSVRLARDPARDPESIRRAALVERGAERGAESDRADDSARHGPPSSSTRKKKILVVDDSFTAIMMCRTILSKRPYDVVTARDGREAIDKALSERPDLILMDVMMPNMDGFQACTRLRALSTTRGIPIFLLTTRGEAESVAQGFASGCNAYISNPLNGPELLAKIKSYRGE